MGDTLPDVQFATDPEGCFLQLLASGWMVLTLFVLDENWTALIIGEAIIIGIYTYMKRKQK